jgi:protein subunit release factor B
MIALYSGTTATCSTSNIIAVDKTPYEVWKKLNRERILKHKKRLRAIDRQIFMFKQRNREYDHLLAEKELIKKEWGKQIKEELEELSREMRKVKNEMLEL